MADSFVMVRTCAARQLDADFPMQIHLGNRRCHEQMLYPNLLLVTGPQHACDDGCRVDCELDHGVLMPVLSIREG